MIPTWMIVEIERRRRESETLERPRPRAELPLRDDPPPARPAPSGPVVLEFCCA